MGNTRRSFALSLGASVLAVWLYFGCPPFGPGPSSMTEGALWNILAKVAVIPLVLAILAGGGLAAARALGSLTGDAATLETERRTLALTAPAGITWIMFVAVMAFPLGPVGNVFVIGSSILAILLILRNALALGIFHEPAPPHDDAGARDGS